MEKDKLKTKETNKETDPTPCMNLNLNPLQMIKRKGMKLKLKLHKIPSENITEWKNYQHMENFPEECRLFKCDHVVNAMVNTTDPEVIVNNATQQHHKWHQGNIPSIAAYRSRLRKYMTELGYKDAVTEVFI